MGPLEGLDGVDGFDAQDPAFHQGPTVGPWPATYGNVTGGSESGGDWVWRAVGFEGGEALVQSGSHECKGLEEIREFGRFGHQMTILPLRKTKVQEFKGRIVGEK